jgi:hypothetical protein
MQRDKRLKRSGNTKADNVDAVDGTVVLAPVIVAPFKDVGERDLRNISI